MVSVIDRYLNLRPMDVSESEFDSLRPSTTIKMTAAPTHPGHLYQQSVALDNLDLSNSGGLEINQTSDSRKLVEFSLSMNKI